MVKHIVMWRLADAPDKAEKAAAIKEQLEALKDKISVIKDIEVGININTTDSASDVVLVSSFETAADLAAYINHPDHKSVGANYVRPNVSERRVVDYEI
ncbi:MAG TPA: Dabb family protein [Candidatus Ornithomonoglobus intestinigallinarum]|uniref:Dabb family protein n=1 Tax=Candidatus Ornithomonoglobus intestinigallinarum TaxID=2840894 RepID=A0A9D1H4I2_9FIRM|nr:Dabb family protein [Candidatus Ornithomonoglobus intestinigallinarum]